MYIHTCIIHVKMYVYSCLYTCTMSICDTRAGYSVLSVNSEAEFSDIKSANTGDQLCQ